MVNLTADEPEHYKLYAQCASDTTAQGIRLYMLLFISM